MTVRPHRSPTIRPMSDPSSIVVHMFDSIAGDSGSTATLTRAVASWRQSLARSVRDVPEQARDADDAWLETTGREVVALMAELESFASAAAAVQAQAAVYLDRVRREQERRQRVPPRRRGRGVAAEIGLARRMSVSRASRALGLAHAIGELPRTREALAAGRLSEWRAALIAREAACLDEADRADLDAELCARPETLAGKGDRAVRAAAQRAAYRRDPKSVVRRSSRAESERCVTIRPAPDTMTYLTALLPVAQGTAAYAALRRDADTARTEGETRSGGQVMADLLVERITGQIRAADVPLRVNLVMSDETLLGGEDGPADVAGYGPVPPAWAREQVARACRATGARISRSTPPGSLPPLETATTAESAADVAEARVGADETGRAWIEADGTTVEETGLDEPVTTAKRSGSNPADPAVAEAAGRPPASEADPAGRMAQDDRAAARLWIRRLYVAPETGALVALESRSRGAPDGLADFIRLRDEHRCRVPWCDAPARHIDHVRGWQHGGETDASNLQSLCEAHNYAKEASGWVAEVHQPEAEPRGTRDGSDDGSDVGSERVPRRTSGGRGTSNASNASNARDRTDVSGDSATSSASGAGNRGADDSSSTGRRPGDGEIPDDPGARRRASRHRHEVRYRTPSSGPARSVAPQMHHPGGRQESGRRPGRAATRAAPDGDSEAA